MSKSLVPVRKWTRPGFFERVSNKHKPDRFVFERLPDPLCPIALNVGDIHLRWEDGYWVNLGTDYEAALIEVDEEKAQQLIQENEDMCAQIEVLLDMNTAYELKKAHLQEKLQRLEAQIRSFPGLDDSNY